MMVMALSGFINAAIIYLTAAFIPASTLTAKLA